MKNLDCKSRPKVPISTGILIMLWILSNQESFRSVGYRFNCSIGHTYEIFIKICKLFYSQLLKVYISWPKGNEAIEMVKKFNNLRGPHSFPNVLGKIVGKKKLLYFCN